MNQAGITIERNAQGLPAFVRIDINRYGSQLEKFFSSIDVAIDDIPNRDTKKALLEAHTKKMNTYENSDALLADLYS
jgi:hypothetical protein